MEKDDLTVANEFDATGFDFVDLECAAGLRRNPIKTFQLK